MSTLKFSRVGWAVALLVASSAAFAQPAQSMEERLRTQLRATTTQLQQAQNELAALKAGASARPAAPAESPGEVAALKKELAREKAQAATERAARDRQGDNHRQAQEQAQEVVARSNAQVAQFKAAYDELLKLARASEAERQRVVSESAFQRTAVQQCEAKNTQLYATAQEILRAYETVDFNTVMSSRQPFAAQSRVKLEQVAQQYGDTLHAQRFDARAVAAPAAASAPTTP